MTLRNFQKNKPSHLNRSFSLKRVWILFLTGTLLFGAIASTGVVALAPGAPQNLALTPGVKQIELSWDPPLDDGGAAISQYNVYRGVDSGSLTLLDTTTTLTYTDTGLGDGETWFYAVSAENVDGEGPQTSAASATTHDLSSAPQNLAATGDNGQIDLSWNAPADDGGSAVTNYKIYSGTTSGALTLLDTIAAIPTTYSHTGLGDGETHFYHVIAVNGVGDSPPSTEESATTFDVSSVPQNLAATGGNAQIDLAWDAPADDGGSAVTNYKIYSGTTSGALTLLDTIAATPTTYSHTGLGDGETHFYHVIAVNGVGDSPASSEDSATTQDVPSTPQNLAATGGNAQIDLSWDAPTDDGGSAVTNYKIYSGTTSGALTLLDTIAATPTTYSHTGLGDGETHFYHVIAVNAVGDSLASSEDSATTFDVPGTPTNLQAAGNRGNITLTWDVPADDGGSAITGYQVYGADEEAGPFSSLGSTGADTREFIELSLENGVSRYYRVNATNAVGEGAAGNVNATTWQSSGGGGGGGPRSFVDTTIREQSPASDSLRSYRTYSTHLDEGGTLEVSFPDEEPVLERVEVQLTDRRYYVSLSVDVLDPEQVDSLAEDSGFHGMDSLRFELRDRDGPLGHDAVEEAIVVLKADLDDLGEQGSQALMFLRFDEETGLWQAQETSLLSEDDSQAVVQANLSGFSRFTFALDVEAPGVAFAGNLNASGALDPVTVTVSDNRGVATVELLLDGNPVEVEFDGHNATFAPDEPLPAGPHALEAIVTDHSGNMAVQTATLDVADEETDDSGAPSSESEEETQGSPAAGIVFVLLAVFVGLVGWRHRRNA